MTNEQSKAMRLADALDELDAQFSFSGLCGEAASELRRLHELHVLYRDKVERLEAAVKAEREHIAQSLEKQADLATDKFERTWALQMATAIRARGKQ